MIIPHLVLAHLVGDYMLQTDWLVARKSQAWDGLLLHGMMVAGMSAVAVAPYIGEMVAPLLALWVLHTLQDWFKIWITRKLPIHMAWSYIADQVLHFGLIIIIQQWVDAHATICTGHFEVVVFSVLAGLLAVTRMYEVSWWANWFEMIVYMNRWQLWGYAERASAMFLSMTGFAGVVLALTVGLPRLYWSKRIGRPIWKQRHGLIEWGLGIVVSIAVGYGVLYRI